MLASRGTTLGTLAAGAEFSKQRRADKLAREFAYRASTYSTSRNGKVTVFQKS